MPYKQFDRGGLRLKPLAERKHDLGLDIMLYPDSPLPEFNHPTFAALAERIAAAREKGASIIMMMGAHVIRSGVSPLLIDLMKRGYITHFALNGAGSIHDFELAMIGETTESVARYIREGQFGLWNETGCINEAVNAGVKEGLGFGESVGRWICEKQFPHRDISLLAAGYEHRVPVTVHVGIGCDIIHEHPNFSGAATGEATYNDFLVYTNSVTHLEGGVFLNFGSAVIGPEVYLKALSMSRNVAHQEGKEIAHFTTAVFDLQDLDETGLTEPDKCDARYYFRPWKTILVRTVADGGESFYVKGRHRDTVSALYRALTGDNA